MASTFNIIALFRLILYSSVLYSYFKGRFLMEFKNNDNEMNACD